jgi:SAM-dependent methyltransferase
MTPRTAVLVEEPQFSSHYVEWRQARIAAIRAHYGDRFFAGKTLLELGCGHGDIGAAFAALGAHVTCCDAREEHLAVVRARSPHIATVRADLDREWPLQRYDIILHLGLLYHLEPTHASLRRCCGSCTHLVLETEVCDSSDPELVLIAAEEGYDQAFSGTGCRPSARRVERVLAHEGMIVDRVVDSRCNSGIHIYDWPIRETHGAPEGLRRFWFALNAGCSR